MDTGPADRHDGENRACVYHVAGSGHASRNNNNNNRIDVTGGRDRPRDRRDPPGHAVTPSAAARRSLLGWLAIMRDDAASRGDADLAAACAEALGKLGPSPRRARDEALVLLRRVAFDDLRDAPAAAAIVQAARDYFATRHARAVESGRAPVSEPDQTFFALASLGYDGARFPSARTIRAILGESVCG